MKSLGLFIDLDACLGVICVLSGGASGLKYCVLGRFSDFTKVQVEA